MTRNAYDDGFMERFMGSDEPHESPTPSIVKYPGYVRLAILLGGTIASWGAIITIIEMVRTSV